jgi:hypothetical protein
MITQTQRLPSILLASFIYLGLPLSLAAQVTINVPGSSDPFLAGMPDGSTASIGDIAPDQSPVQVLGLAISPMSTLNFHATGMVHFQAPASDGNGPDGDQKLFGSHATGDENGISNYIMPANALLGVFLSNAQPDLTAAPTTLDFRVNGNVPNGVEYNSLYPELQQTFFIGDGMTSSGVLQAVTAPAGATRLFLGTMDGQGWLNNTGSFQVTIAEALICNFDGDFDCDIDDLNLLLGEGPLAIPISVVPGQNDQFDLNGDGTLSMQDRDLWLIEAANANGLSSAYKLGDANLDGAVNGQDFLAWNTNKFNLSLKWNDGDFTSDGVVNGADFLDWNANKFTSSDSMNVVPEPIAATWALLALATFFQCRSLNKSNTQTDVRQNNDMHRSRTNRDGSDYVG